MKNLVLAAVLAASLSVPAMAQDDQRTSETWTASGVKLLTIRKGISTAVFTTDQALMNYQYTRVNRMPAVGTRPFSNTPNAYMVITLNGVRITTLKAAEQLVGATCSMEGETRYSGTLPASDSQISSNIISQTPIITKATCTK
jgi:hypothetical protein